MINHNPLKINDNQISMGNTKQQQQQPKEKKNWRIENEMKLVGQNW